MELLIIFIIGVFVGRYIFNIFDNLEVLISNKVSLSSTKTQVKINKLLQNKEEVNTQVVGFQYESDDLYDDEEV